MFRPRHLLAVAALILVVLLVWPGDEPAGLRSPRQDPIGSGPTVVPPAIAESGPSLRPVVTAFVAAFLRYEVGVLGASVRSAIKAAATPHFARDLLDHPPRFSGATTRLPLRSSLTRLSIDYLSRNPDRALVTGSATRPTGPEEFSFLFERQRRRWRALGPAE